MARTTEDLIKGIMEVDSAITDFDPFIAVANELVTEKCSTDDYDEARLTLIETWLAAHFVAVRDLRVGSNKAGPVAESFQYKLGLNLDSTMYGQQAKILDTAGGLASLDAQAKDGTPTRSFSLLWLGTEEE